MDCKDQELPPLNVTRMGVSDSQFQVQGIEANNQKLRDIAVFVCLFRLPDGVTHHFDQNISLLMRSSI